MYTFNYISHIPEIGFYWVLLAPKEEWIIMFMNDHTFAEIIKEQPQSVFCGPIVKPGPKDAIKLGRGSMKINRDKPVRNV